MKCQNCGAEIGNNKFCQFCGTQVTAEMRREQEILNKKGCPKCGSSNVQFNRENQGEVQGKNNKRIVHKTVGFCKDCGYTWYPNNAAGTKKNDNMVWWILGWIFFFPAPLMVLIWRKKNTWDIKIKIGVTVAFWLLFIVIGLSGNKEKASLTDADQNAEETIVESTDKSAKDDAVENRKGELLLSSEEQVDVPDELGVLREELKDKYDVSEPRGFVKGDSTGEWKIVKVANETPTSDYAVDYAKAYMKDGDIHYIVNFTLKTTSQFRLSSGKLSVKTTEYVDKEEHDASIIGEGMLYDEHYYDMATGEEITTESDENAGTVDSDALVAAVKNVIDGSVGSDEKITDVTFDGNNLVITVDLSDADTSKLSAELIAESRVSTITDEILSLDDSYYNTWETITIDFGDIGSITMDKSKVKDEGFGKYFEVPVGCFE